MKRNLLLSFSLLLFLFSCKRDNTNTTVEIITTHGDIVVRLYDDTPLHRDNFIKLVDNHSYDSMLFHRVINHFMIQSGDPDSRHANARTVLGSNSLGETIPAEFIPHHFHKKGALAAARMGDRENPEKKSSGSHFYLVQGKVYSPEEMEDRVNTINESRKTNVYRQLIETRRVEFDSLQQKLDIEGMERFTEELTAACDSIFEKNRLILTPEQSKAYTTIGGTPHLDGQYTVFGEVIEGLDIIDKIAAVETNQHDRPLYDVRILRMKKKR